jgi:hypothetical protein
MSATHEGRPSDLKGEDGSLGGRLQPENGGANESAATFKWLAAQLGLDRGDKTAIRAAWKQARKIMLCESSSGQIIDQPVNWISDFWIARGAKSGPVLHHLAPEWVPPMDITHWPSFGAAGVAELFAGTARRSNNANLFETLSATPESNDPETTAREALAWFYKLKAGLTPRVFDLPAIQTEHVRVWLGTSIGHLLMAVPLALDVEASAAAEALTYRLALVQRGEYETIDQIGDRRLERLYNARVGQDGQLSIAPVRVGQGPEWRDHWLTLSLDIGAEEASEAVRMAARVLRCPRLFQGLATALNSDDDQFRLLATAVLRRWLLTLQVMAWLEVALSRAWSDIRPKDLCCFALNATKPEWPRRIVAISHRSQDAKHDLRRTYAWREGRIAIDANYVPSWETNIGMIWGLFAATPAIVRINSPTYGDSVWCRRELELTDYLLKESDFLAERWIIDLDLTRVKEIDTIVDRWGRPETVGKPLLPPRQFPPVIEVCSPGPMPAWEVRMLRASAALRMIHAVYPGPKAVNQLALLIQGGKEPSGIPAPTNNPDQWRTYGEIFREAAETFGVAPGELALQLPSEYGRQEMERDLRLATFIPDLGTGSPALSDVLVAMEWLCVEFPQFLDRRGGDFLAINCQRLTRTAWESDEGVSLLRGLAAMRPRLPMPVWIIQWAGQDVESWPLIGDAPIFTEHAEAQFGRMIEATFDRRESQSRYPMDSGMVLAPALIARCCATGPSSR